MGQLEQRSESRLVLDGYVAPHRGNYFNSAKVNISYPMEYGHMEQQFRNLNGNADWTGGQPMGMGHVASPLGSFPVGWCYNGHVACQPGMATYNLMGAAYHVWTCGRSSFQCSRGWHRPLSSTYGWVIAGRSKVQRILGWGSQQCLASWM